MSSSVSDFVRFSARCFHGPSVLSRVPASHSFLLLRNIPLCGYVTFLLKSNSLLKLSRREKYRRERTASHITPLFMWLIMGHTFNISKRMIF